eukprot:m.232157 g.232157  ORF g.232157 m.232157 type:complete len:325 (+) comp26049_c0_seq1:416-1390(+)
MGGASSASMPYLEIVAANAFFNSSSKTKRRCPRSHTTAVRSALSPTIVTAGTTPCFSLHRASTSTSADSTASRRLCALTGAVVSHTPSGSFSSRTEALWYRSLTCSAVVAAHAGESDRCSAYVSLLVGPAALGPGGASADINSVVTCPITSRRSLSRAMQLSGVAAHPSPQVAARSDNRLTDGKAPPLAQVVAMEGALSISVCTRWSPRGTSAASIAVHSSGVDAARRASERRGSRIRPDIMVERWRGSSPQALVPRREDTHTHTPHTRLTQIHRERGVGKETHACTRRCFWAGRRPDHTSPQSFVSATVWTLDKRTTWYTIIL